MHLAISDQIGSNDVSVCYSEQLKHLAGYALFHIAGILTGLPDQYIEWLRLSDLAFDQRSHRYSLGRAKCWSEMSKVGSR